MVNDLFRSKTCYMEGQTVNGIFRPKISRIIKGNGNYEKLFVKPIHKKLTGQLTDLYDNEYSIKNNLKLIQIEDNKGKKNSFIFNYFYGLSDKEQQTLKKWQVQRKNVSVTYLACDSSPVYNNHYNSTEYDDPEIEILSISLNE